MELGIGHYNAGTGPTGRAGAPDDVTTQRNRLAEFGVVALCGSNHWTARELDLLIDAYQRISEHDMHLLQGLVVIRDHVEPPETPGSSSRLTEAATHAPGIDYISKLHIHFYNYAFDPPTEEDEKLWTDNVALRVPVHELAHRWLHRNSNGGILATAENEYDQATTAVRKAKVDLAAALEPARVSDVTKTLNEITEAMQKRRFALTKVMDALLDRTKDGQLSPAMGDVDRLDSLRRDFRRTERTQCDLLLRKLPEMRQHITTLVRSLKKSPHQKTAKAFAESWRRYKDVRARYGQVLIEWTGVWQTLCDFAWLAAKHRFEPVNTRANQSVEEWYAETYALVRLTDAKGVPDPIKQWFADGLSRQKRPRDS